MKTISITILLSFILFACTNHNKATSKIKGSYSNKDLRIEIKEVSSGKNINSSKTSITKPLIDAKAENAKLATILDLVLETEHIEIKNKALEKMLFDFELECFKELPKQDSIIASYLLPMISAKYSITPIYTDSLSISIQDREKLMQYRAAKESIPEEKNCSKSIKINDSLSVENFTLDKLMKKINKQYPFTYTISCKDEIKIDYAIDLSDWENVKLTLSQDLGLKLKIYQTESYKLVIE